MPRMESATVATGNDLYIVNTGEEACAPLHAYGPAQRKHYLIHFVLSGCGTLHYEGESVTVRAGQGFLILPDETTRYQADEHTPWHYAWVGYRGRQAEYITRAAGLDGKNRIFTAEDPAAVWEILQDMRSDARVLRLNQLAAAGCLLRFIAHIAPAQDPKSALSSARDYCDKALWYLEGNYDRAVSIQETADFVGLSRSHLYRLMTAEYGQTPKEILLSIRMRHAKQLLRESALTLDDIARLIGLQTGAQLGVIFRTAFGITPGQYRKKRSSLDNFPSSIV
ncbi:MAG: AraC family transcriptional regulator [Clostridia bacterium]|nr:AraC family transcriptional regulator [Clostridia bacterium]